MSSKVSYANTTFCSQVCIAILWVELNRVTLSTSAKLWSPGSGSNRICTTLSGDDCTLVLRSSVVKVVVPECLY
jgi:hypothetical protein